MGGAHFTVCGVEFGSVPVSVNLNDNYKKYYYSYLNRLDH